MAGEGSELSPHSGSPDLPPTTKLLDFVHFHSAWVLFVVFLLAFIANSILTAEASAETEGPILTGPGGKPLPSTSALRAKKERESREQSREFSSGKKLLFLYSSAALIGTFVANAVNIVLHALSTGGNGWWCGESMAVSGD